MTDISVPWGEDELKIALPPDWTLQQVAEPALRPAPEDWPDRLARVIATGTTAGGLSLEKLLAARRNGRIVIIVEDMTRHSPLKQILPIVLREIRHARIKDDQVEIFFANGMHPPMTATQVEEKLGETREGIAWSCNTWPDETSFERIGSVGNIDIRIHKKVVSADLRILISSVSPHLQAGFGGGYKMILPGCAAKSCIRELHRLGLGRRPRQLVGGDASQNAMRQTIDATGKLLDSYHGRSYSIQFLLDGADQPTVVAAGDVEPTHQMLAKQCSVACGVVVPTPGDVLVTNGHPRDYDLWQSFKCVANTRWAVRPNGVIICLTQCPAGLHGMKPPPWPLSPKWTRRFVKWMGPDGIGSLVMRLVPRLAGDAAFFVRIASHTIYRNPIFMVSPHLHETGITFPGLHIFGNVDDAIASANEYLGGGPQRVVVFPSGGVTFPVPTVERA